MSDDPDRLNEISARFHDAGYDLRFYESMPGAWDAIWHPHGTESGLTRSTTHRERTTTGATIMQAAEAALAELERSAPAPPG